MSTKSRVLDMVSNLPDDSTLDDIGYRLYVLESIEQGIAELDKGEYLSHDAAKKELAKWIKE
jgi:predicted transcriptional regulator